MKKLLLTALAATFVFAFGGLALAQVAKVTICHFPPGNPDNAQVITIGAPAVAPHVALHNDAVCAEGDTDCCFGATAGTSVCTDLLTDVNNCGACGTVCPVE